MNKDCGIGDVQPNMRIVGGIEAVQNSWPYSILLIQTYETDVNITGYTTVHVKQQFACGGTIISNRTVLTAAHCVNGGTFEYFDPYGIRHVIEMIPNKYYPTMESMFKVYAGLHKNDYTSRMNSLELSVFKIKVVIKFNWKK